MTAEILITTDLKREAGFLYYVGTDKNGNLTLCRSVMARGRKSKDKK